MLRRHLCSSLVAVWLCAALAVSAANAEPRDALVSVADMAPTQTEVGREDIVQRVDRWERQARKVDLDLAGYARQVLVPRYRERKLPAILDPEGRVRVTDGHHRVSSLLIVRERTGVDIAMPIEVVHDYRGWAENDYARHMIEQLGIGYFAGVADSEASAQIAQLPNGFAELGDNPMRSLVGAVFDRADLAGSDFTSYIEFRVGDRLLAEGLLTKMRAEGLIGSSLPSNAGSKKQLLRRVEHAIFTKPNHLAFLRNNIHPSRNRKKMIAKLRKRALKVRERKAPRAVDHTLPVFMARGTIAMQRRSGVRSAWRVQNGRPAGRSILSQSAVRAYLPVSAPARSSRGR